MQYFVIWPDGQKFGPADVSQLNTWVQENRITGDTELESVESGARLKARDLPGLHFSQPVQDVQPVPQYSTSQSQQPVTVAASSGPVQYYVIGAGGQKYGPANAATLTQWAAESRLTPSTELEDTVTGQRVLASQVPSIVFPMNVAGGGMSAPSQVQNPYGTTGASQASSPYGVPSNYPRDSMQYTSDVGKNEATQSIIMSAIGVFCCCFLLIGGFIQGYKAKSLGHPMGKTAVIVAWVALGVWLMFALVQLVPIMAAIGNSTTGGFAP